MNEAAPITAEQFAETRFDLPDGGRWTELDRGRVIQFQPPDEAHGNVVYNLSKALGAYFRPEAGVDGYACFELGLRVARDPDTVRAPAACCFVAGERFAEADKPFTDARPALIAEIASTNDRRRTTAARVEEYLAWGVEFLWIIDTAAQRVHVYRRGREPQTIDARQPLTADSVLPGFSTPVHTLFAEPEWYRGR